MKVKTSIPVSPYLNGEHCSDSSHKRYAESSGLRPQDVTASHADFSLVRDGNPTAFSAGRPSKDPEDGVWWKCGSSSDDLDTVYRQTHTSAPS
jgi:hypothetical protein